MACFYYWFRLGFSKEVKKMVNKEWYKSKTVWACAASLVVAVATALWGETNSFVAGLVAVFSATGIYGRFTASGKLK